MHRPDPYTVFYWAVLVVLCAGCSVKPHGAFTVERIPPAPDYSDAIHWAALPTKFDSADVLPPGGLDDVQEQALVDVFFVHPTTYTGKRGHNRWNASLSDQKLNERTDAGSMKFQASIFNGVGKVYAPRYRQAHLEAFYTKKRTAEGEKALNLAYEDVRSAFEYYLKHWNGGRPLIIAAHSQGTLHAGRLLREYFENKPLADQLVVAYLVGMPVPDRFFKTLQVCESAEQTGCFCTWRTVKDGFFPKKWPASDSILVTNPISWSVNEEWAYRTLHRGAVLKRFKDGPYTQYTDARISSGYLWVPKPKIPGVPILPTRNYHIIDLNLFYVDVRENAQLRTEAYFNDKS